MSYTTMHGVPESGEIVRLKVYRNAHHSAFLWWKVIAEHYGPGKDGELHIHDFDFFRDCFIGSTGDTDGMGRVWNLARNKVVDPVHRAIIRLTFDDVMVERKRLPEFADLLDRFVADFGTINTGHAQKIAEDVRGLIADCVTFDGICFTWTSVADDMWMREDTSEKDECGDKFWRPFDLSKDAPPQWLFQSMIQAGLWDGDVK